MRALMDLAIEPALSLFEVSAVIVSLSSQQAAKRVLRVLAATPQGALRIVRNRYPRSKSLQVVAKSQAEQHEGD